MGPIDYSIDVKSPFEQAIGGYQVGLQLGDQNLKRQDAERARQLAIQQQADLGQLASNPNPSARDYATVMTKYPGIAEHLKKGFDILQPEQQQAILSHATEVQAALNSGQNDIAVQKLTDWATMMRNSGKEAQAKAAETQAKLIQLDPANAAKTGNLFLSSVMGADKFAQTFPALGKESRDTALAPSTLDKSLSDAEKARYETGIKREELLNTPEALRLKAGKTDAEIRNINSEILTRAGQLDVNRDTLLTNTQIEKLKLDLKDREIPEDARKLVNALGQGVVLKTNQSNKALDLAARMEELKSQGGIFTTGWNETMRALGVEGDAQALRQEYARLRNGNIMATLPSAFHQNFSNTDREFVEKGIPKEDADPKYIAGFLRATGKVLAAEAAADRATAAWVGANQSLADARKDIIVDGIKVPAGNSFADFTKQYVKRMNEEFKAQNSLKEAREKRREYLAPLDAQGRPQTGATGTY